MPDTRDWNLRGIWGTSGTNLWVSGGPSPSPQNPFVQPAGQFRRFDGQAWQLVTVPTSDLFQSIAGTSPTDIYADSGVRLWHYDGVSWTVRASARPPGQRLWMLGSSTLLSAVPSTPSVFDGTGWTYLDAPMPCSFVWGKGTKDLLAAGGNVNRSGLYRYDGTRWTWLRSGITLEDFHDVWGASASSVYAAGTSGTLARFDGKTWRLIPSGTTATFDRVRGSGPSSAFAWGHAGPGSAAHVFFSDSSSARALPSPGVPINDLFARSPNEAYAVGDAGFLARFDGQSWTRIPHYYSYDFVSVTGLAPQKLVLLSRNGRIVTFDGTSWSDVNPYDRVSGFAGTRNPLTAVCSDGAATLAVVGDNGRILVFDGTTWSTRSLLPSPFGTGPKTCVTLGPNEIWWGPRRYPMDPAPMRTATQAPVRAMFPFSTELFAVGDVGTIVHRKLP
ncbi:MAG: hypothetical protein IT371_09250 [Deltaproteobacteria bacterium]|nr:hypothetical protein [Deltaproteobacteria bacterium]